MQSSGGPAGACDEGGSLWDAIAAWDDCIDETSRTVDLVMPQFDKVHVIERATNRKIGMWGIWKIGEANETQKITCDLHGCQKIIQSRRMPAPDKLRAAFEDGLTYRDRTPENKERHLKVFNDLISEKDREIGGASSSST